MVASSAPARRRLAPIAALAVLVALVAALLTTLAPPATAAPVIYGRVVDVTSGAALGGFSVRLVQNNGGSAGAVVDTASTNADGYFTLDAPSRPGGYFVQHLAGRYQAGWVGGPQTERYFQDRFANADAYAGGAKLGRIYANPAFIRGVVVDSVTGGRVAGLKVTARGVTSLGTVEAAATTDRLGRFELTGIDFEDDGALKFAGAPIGYEAGYLACDYTVVPTWGEACATPIGVLSQPVEIDNTIG